MSEKNLEQEIAAQVAPMTVSAAKAKRGRPRLPEDNETRERIFASAQTLFAQRSFTQVSVREIAEEAGVNLAAMNYHFGSKDGLVLALFKRVAPKLVAERSQLLEAAMRLDAPREERVRAVVRALIAPVIRWSTLSDTQRYYVPFLARVRLDGPPEIRRLEASAVHREPFIRALHALLPELPLAELCWRLHFILGIEHAIHTDALSLQAMSDGACDLTDPESIIDRVLQFAVPGLLMPP